MRQTGLLKVEDFDETGSVVSASSHRTVKSTNTTKTGKSGRSTVGTGEQRGEEARRKSTLDVAKSTGNENRKYELEAAEAHPYDSDLDSEDEYGDREEKKDVFDTPVDALGDSIAFSSDVWGKDVVKQLGEYSKWHTNHPHCSTPKLKQSLPRSFADSCLKDENNPNLVYYRDPIERKALSEEFLPKYKGHDAEFSFVSDVSHAYEHTVRLDNGDNFGDLWWKRSVAEQIKHTEPKLASSSPKAADTPNAKKKKQKPPQIKYTPEKADVEFITTSPSDSVVQPFSGEGDSSSRYRQWESPPRVKKSAWADSTNKTRFTKDANECLKEYKHHELQQNIEIALQEFHDDSSSIVSGKIAKQRSSPSTKEVQAKKQLLAMEQSLGGEEKVKHLGEDFVKMAKKYKNASNSGLFDGRINIVDACRRGNAMQAIPLLLFGANANSLNENDEPILVSTFRNVLLLDATIGLEENKNSKIRQNYVKILDALVKHGARVNALVGDQMLSMLHLASSLGNEDMVRWAIRNGVDPSTKTKFYGVSALMMASKSGYVVCMAELLKAGAPLDDVDENGWSALHYAGAYGQSKSALFLLRVGASRQALNKDQMIPAGLASASGYRVTSQIIMGYAPPPKVAAKPLLFLESKLEAKKSTVIESSILDRLGKAVNWFTSANKTAEQADDNGEEDDSGVAEKLAKWGNVLLASCSDLYYWILRRLATRKSVVPEKQPVNM